MIRILIADDSAFMRKILSDLFREQSDFEVVGTAINGQDAVEKVKRLQPDVLTLDVIMPVMNGLDALAIIMDQCPLPVVMISSATQKGANETIRALALGAVDFVSKVGGAISKIDAIKDEILEKCRMAAKAHARKNVASTMLPVYRANPTVEEDDMHRIELRRRRGFVPGQRTTVHRLKTQTETVRKVIPPTGKRLVVIGTSTGGPQALQSVITCLPSNLPCGVVVVQHMPAGFTKSLADRLDSISRIAVKEAENDEIIRRGQVYIAPGNYHLRISPIAGGERKIVLSQEPPVGNHRPAVNVMFDSAAQFGKDLVSVIMTGMGCDGCEGMKKIKAAGGYSIAQDESTCVVYGMPKAVVDAGLADEIRPLNKIAEAIVEAVKR
ncbi:MAG: chemotaxis response regulator protein-glutamate methylesterase [Selenomonadaceae bacterium]|nr:chemotaxis response regulator protein-glutamate methylesterase [Selenomonadaceae bacterium]